MAYLGNNLQAAFSSYKIIDDISASFNGSTTLFPLTVNGIAPVPAPINVQQCLISVGGVPQEPDSSGVDGFNLVGGNIVFSSAPAAGLKFWGVILAGADYVTAGTAYPNGSVNNPSITFSSNTNTGLYLSSPNVLGFTVNGASVATLSSSGLSLGTSTTLSSPNLRLNGAISGQITLIAPAAAGSNTLTLPTGNGSANQLLKNSNTAGSLTYSSATEDSSGSFSFNSGYGSASTAYGCRAWVLFNGASATVTGSGNVSSVGRSGTGINTVNFSNSMVDANYSVATSSSQQYRSICVSSRSTTNFTTLCCGVNVNFGDDSAISCVVMR
jgi:hypothetical protein